MYKLRIPFELADGRKMTCEEGYQAFGDRQALVAPSMHEHALTIAGFETEEDARAYFEWVPIGFGWWLIEGGTGAKYSREIKDVHVQDDPVKAGENLARLLRLPADEVMPVDGYVSGNDPAIWNADANIKIETAGRVDIRLGATAERLRECFLEAEALGDGPAARISDAMQTALELYDGFFRETTSNSRFLTLVVTLEVLAGTPRRPRLDIDAHIAAAELID